YCKSHAPSHLFTLSLHDALPIFIAINVGRGTHDAIKLRARRVEAVLEEVSLTLQRLDIGKAMDDARLHLQAELLRDAFHGTLSRSEEHTSELQSRENLVCRLLLE